MLWSIAALLAPGLAHADDIVVSPGVKTLIATSPVQAKKGTPADRVTIEATNGGAPWSVFYTAPAGTADGNDTAAWTTPKGTETRTVRIGAAASGVYGASARALFALFAIALILESALHLVFTWRPFITTFDGSAVKPLLSLVVALVVVWTSGLDIATDLIKSYLTGPPGPEFPGKVLTAMVLAGGSSGVNRLMQSLGIRPTSAQQNPPAPAALANVAWLSVTVHPGDAVGPVTVLISQTDPVAPSPAEFVLGIVPSSPIFSPPLAFFLRRRDRAPPENGHRLAPGTYAVRLVDKNGVKSATTWGPFGIAAGTLVDVDLTFKAALPV